MQFKKKNQMIMKKDDDWWLSQIGVLKFKIYKMDLFWINIRISFKRVEEKNNKGLKRTTPLWQ